MSLNVEGVVPVNFSIMTTGVVTELLRGTKGKRNDTSSTYERAPYG